MAPDFDMADPTPTMPFVLAGSVAFWDPVSRRLDIGGQCLHVPSSVAVTRLAPNVRVTVTGHRPPEDRHPGR